ncbi:hypothetical protein [Allokutzneria albata]|uniref:Secreted protein n=1 Tax=Allokutzneria albata TaxID=211114 RepID=A0A1H0DQM7_ALLAB|nr:hypothetical protein [Allokutzneria albata]SDN72465.1 hypothetical protein SAMN04489726_7933 [Allokutzneria albata]
MKRAFLSAALALAVTVGLASPASAETIAKFSSADGAAWGSVTWGKFRHMHYPMTLTVHYRPKSGHGRVGVQVEVALRAQPNYDWKYFVGPSSQGGHRTQTTVYETLTPVTGIKLRVCRHLMDGTDVCGKPTRFYRS